MLNKYYFCLSLPPPHSIMWMCPPPMCLQPQPLYIYLSHHFIPIFKYIFYSHPTYTFTSFQSPTPHRSVDAMYLQLSFHLTQVSGPSHFISVHLVILLSFYLPPHCTPVWWVGPVPGTHHEGSGGSMEGTGWINPATLNMWQHGSSFIIRTAETLLDQNYHFLSENRIFLEFT